MISLSHKPIETEKLRAAVLHEKAGALLIFEGVTRDNFAGKRVLELRYEAYEDMAIKELSCLREELLAEYPMARIAMSHRLGVVGIEETSVVIAVSAPHRDEAYQVSRKAIDGLKSRVPIWKKEIYEEGASWKANQ